MMMPSLIVFSDYDGTIAEYGKIHNKAKEAIVLLKMHRIPLVIVSSKTFDELEKIYRVLKLNGPIIFENGAGIAIPTRKNNYKIYQCGVDVGEMQKMVPTIEKIIGEIETIQDMSIERLCAYTGLTKEEAICAKKRKFSMPFIVKKSYISEDEFGELSATLTNFGFALRWGGHFYHVVSLKAGKGDAIRTLIHLLDFPKEMHLRTAAIGNSENDFDMLNVVDHPFLVRNKNSTYIYNNCSYTVTQQYNGEGFFEAVKKILLREGIIKDHLHFQ